MTNFSKRQQEIIDESVKLIAKRGIQELTIKNIANRIGISEPAIYRHFDSKIDIMLGILSVFEDKVQALLGKAQEGYKTPLEQIKTVFINRCVDFSSNPEFSAVIFSEEIFRSDPRLLKKVFSLMKLHQSAMLDYINKAQHKSEIRNDIPPKQLCTIIFGSLRLLITQWRMSQCSFSLIEEAENLWNTLEILIIRRR